MTTLLASSFQVTTIAIMCCLAFVDPNFSLSKLVLSLVVKNIIIHRISIYLILNFFHQFHVWLIGRSINSIGLPSKSLFVFIIYASLFSSPNISSFNSSWRTPKLFDGLIASPKVKTMEGKNIGARSLACSTSGLEGRVGAMGWGVERLTSNSITHTNLHKPNNKLVSA